MGFAAEVSVENIVEVHREHHSEVPVEKIVHRDKIIEVEKIVQVEHCVKAPVDRANG